ncbi:MULTISPECIES: hypothetical protein [unclassified Sphingobium]|uniref:hypothetical protein n=1 Tax=unclassified Sphingobium TaxID=2611147 RepID=UPI000D17C8B7|nr:MULTISPECIES: hypothetical protein [unclassified Sphingobium]PSO13072.1 hypothetical protein C7E20_04880 [Sphingobium sp. AEW4]
MATNFARILDDVNHMDEVLGQKVNLTLPGQNAETSAGENELDSCSANSVGKVTCCAYIPR